MFAFPDVDFHSDGMGAFEKNAGDLVVWQHFAARGADCSARGFGDFAGTSSRIPSSVQVMGRDHCMSGKGALARRQSVIGPLRCDHGAKPRVTKAPFEIVPRDFQRQTGAQTIHCPN